MGSLRERVLAEYVNRTQRSRRLYEEAARVIPAGVTHNTRHFEPHPLFAREASGGNVIDVDGNVYADFWCGHGAHILGHAPVDVIEAVKAQLSKATNYGVCHELEAALAKQVARMVPNAEMVRFPNTGTEASMYAVRLARGFTKAKKVGKFAGGWHGGYDALHVAVKPPFEEPSTQGLTDNTLKDTVVLPFNDLEGARRAIKGESLAAIIVEPVLGSCGVIPARREFLRGLRELCDETGALLIFDEVVTGFRLAPGGAQEYFGVKADLVIMGKILGGGLPIGGIAGPEEIMSLIDLTRRGRDMLVYQGGTFCGNPITMAAGLAMLKRIWDGAIQRRLNVEASRLRGELDAILERCSVVGQTIGEGSIFQTHLGVERVVSPADLEGSDREGQKLYHLFLISRGSLVLPGHMAFLCDAHTKQDWENLLAASEEFAKLYAAEAK